jgi:hypothetical protein
MIPRLILIATLTSTFLFPLGTYAACSAMNDCKTGEVCSAGVCKIVPLGGACDSTEACGNGRTCVANTCVDPNAPTRTGITSVERVTAPPPQSSALVPTLNVPIPGLVFTPPTEDSNTLFAQYISAAYRFLISVAAVAATVMMIYGAFMYLTGTAIGTVKYGKGVMQDAIIGMLLVLGTHLLLYTVNPETTTLKGLTLNAVRGIDWFKDEEGNATATPGAGGPSKAVCGVAPKTIQECADLCDSNGPWPPRPSQIADPASLRSIPNTPGLVGSGILKPEAVAGLVAAAAKAQSWPGGPFELVVGSTYRSYEEQISLACKKENRSALMRGTIARPGGSNHGIGVAIDIMLQKDKKILVHCCDTLKQTNDGQENAAILNGIMTAAGWTRLCSELWHFEWGTEGLLGGRSKNCPWPPK